MTGSFFRLAPSSRRTKRIVIVLAVLYALYALAAGLIGPVIVRRVLLERLSARLHRPVTVGRVRVNPFSITVTVDSLRVADRDGSTLLSWDRFSLNVDLLSIVRREIDLDEIRLERPYARFVIRRDGTMNISDIVDSMSAESARHPSTGPAPVFAVSGLHIADARVDILDSEPARPFATTIGPWRIDLASFSTRRDNTGQYSFSGSMLTGERFAWVGTFAMDPVRSAGQLTVDSVRFGTYGPFYERNVAFALTSGVWGIHAKYSVDLAPRAQILRMSEGSAYARGFTLVGRAHGDTAVTVDRLEVTGVEADAVANTARVASVALSGANVRVIRSRDSSLNVMRLLATAKDAAPAASARAPNAAPPRPWRWMVGHIGVDSSDLSVLDSVPKRSARFGISAIHLAVDTISSDSAQISRVQTALLWEQKGVFTAGGTVAMWRRSGDLTYTAKDLPLGPFDAYLPPTANLLIRDGTLLSDGSLHFEWADTLHPELRYAGNVRVDRFATVDIKRHEPFFKFRSLRMPGITYALRQPSLSIKSIDLEAPEAAIWLLPDGTSILKEVFPKPGEDSALAAADSAAARAAADSVVADTTKHDSASRSAAAPPPAAPPPVPPPTPPPAAPKKAKGSAKSAPSAPQMRTSIGSFKMTDGLISLTDRAMQPPVSLTIEKLQAITGRITTDSLGVGTLEMSAAVDGVAPLRVSGRFNPLSSKEGSDLIVEMQGMEMVPIGPYFGKYLGYGISTGKLKIGMQYRVLARHLKSENKLTLDGFEWGEPSNSPTATKLPVKVAFSVMRDRSGQIVFDVPMEGNMDDPSFRFGRVFIRALVNVFTKLATSPLKLLGAAFGGAKPADLSYAGFQPGSSTLDGEATGKLDVLAKALYERPGLKLQITGSADSAADPVGLKRMRLDAKLREVKWNSLRAQEMNPGPPDSLLISPAVRPSWLAGAFAATFPTDSAVVRTKGKPNELPYPPDVMEQKLMATITIAPADIQLLAAARAKACLDYLLTRPANKIEAERVLLTGGALKTEGPKALFTLQ